MSLRALLLRILLPAAICAAGTASAFAPAAFADDPAPAAASDADSAVAKLTPDELRFVRIRMPDWDRREAAEQERVAANVLRIRAMSPEMKQKFFERARRTEAAGLGSAIVPRIDEFRKRRPDERRDVQEGHRLSRAVVFALVSELPPASRAVIGDGRGDGKDDGKADGKDESAGLEVQERYAFEACVFEQWRRRVKDFLIEHPPVDAEPYPASPPAIADAFEKMRDEVKTQGGAKAPRDLRMKYALVYAQDRMRAALRTAPPSEPDQTRDTHRAHERALSKAIRAAFPEAFDLLLAELGPVVLGGRDAIVTWCREHAPERATPRSVRMMEAVIAIERSREFLPDALREPAERLQDGILRELKLTEAEADEARRREGDEPGARYKRLMKLKDRFGGGFGFLTGPRRGFGDRRNGPQGPAMGDSPMN